MNSPVSWTPEGHPLSQQYDDVYHTTSGALKQAEHVFLHGCKLPQRWQERQNFIILETGFGLGLNFLATWLKWQQDPKRCPRLHFVSVEAHPVNAQDILRCLEQIPELQALGQRLAHDYPICLPGLHRIEFDEGDLGQVVLTLAIGDARKLLPQLQLQADAVFLDGFSPAKNPELWGRDICASLSKLCADHAHIATWCVAGDVRRHLQAVGFNVQRVLGLAPKREALTGIFTPQRLTRRKISNQAGVVHDKIKEVIVIGAGFAGATLCHALAKRGWQVRLIDKAAHAAGGASGLPIGLGVPNVSEDDALLTQITRAGTQWLKRIVKACELDAQYWKDTPVEQLVKTQQEATIPKAWGALGKQVFEPAFTDEGQPCRHFHQGMRLEGPAFIEALLNHSPNLVCQWNTEITRIEQLPNGHWQLFNQHDQLCAQCAHVVVAAAMSSLTLCELENKALTPNRGQITLGFTTIDNPQHFLDARTGHGHFLLPLRNDVSWTWSMGSTFTHNCDIMDVLPESHQEIYEKLQMLSPRTAKQLQQTFEAQDLDAFVEVRCTSSDHLPLVGAVPDFNALANMDATRLMNEDCPILPGLFIFSALGSRGLSAGALCAELLASMMNHEPWPLTKQQANALLPARFELRQRRKSKK